MACRPVYSAAEYRGIRKDAATAAVPIIVSFIKFTVENLLPSLDKRDREREFPSSTDFFTALSFFCRIPFLDVLSQLPEGSPKQNLQSALDHLENALEQEKNLLAKLKPPKKLSSGSGKEEEPKEPEEWIPKPVGALKLPTRAFLVPAQAPAELYMHTVLQDMVRSGVSMKLEAIKAKLPQYAQTIDNPENKDNGTPKCFIVSLGHLNIANGITRDWICATSNATWGDFKSLADWAKAARHSRFGQDPSDVGKYEDCIASQTQKFMNLFPPKSEAMPKWNEGYFDHLNHEAAAFFFPSGRQRPRCPRCKALFQWKNIADANDTKYYERYADTPCSCSEVMIHNLTCKAERINPWKLTRNPYIDEPWTLTERPPATKSHELQNEKDFPNLKSTGSSANPSSGQSGTPSSDPNNNNLLPSAQPLPKWGPQAKAPPSTTPAQKSPPTTQILPPATIPTKPTIPSQPPLAKKSTAPAPELPSSDRKPTSSTTVKQPPPPTVPTQPALPKPPATVTEPKRTVPAPKPAAPAKNTPPPASNTKGKK